MVQMYFPLTREYGSPYIERFPRRYFSERTLELARANAGVFTVPASGDPGDGEAPEELTTRVTTIFQQHNNRYCLTYSLASALFYCGYRDQATIFYHQAETLSNLNFEMSLKGIRSLMEMFIPEIGKPTVFGRKIKRSSRLRRRITCEELVLNKTRYPTVVIPRMSDGTRRHAFCVVDDLIFDSITPFALKLKLESFEWIFNGSQVEIAEALRFETKHSGDGRKLKRQYTREQKTNWN